MNLAFRAFLAFCLSAWSTAAAADPVQNITAQAQDFCESFENGAFAISDAVSVADLDGDGAPDRLVDESRFNCTSMASAYCGSGGCGLHAVIGDRTWRFQALGWRMIDWDGQPILLIARDGVWCGGSGAQVCYEAIVWSNGDVLTMARPSP